MKKLATPAWANRKKMRSLILEARRRRRMGEDVEIDHTVPLCHHLVCGLHCETNMRIVHRKVNQAKRNFRWPDMPDEQVDAFDDWYEPHQLRIL